MCLNVSEGGVQCESFAIISIDYLLVYESKYYLQVYLDNCTYKVVNTQMIGYLDGNFFECDPFFDFMTGSFKCRIAVELV